MTLQMVEAIATSCYIFCGCMAGAALGSGFMCFAARAARGESWMKGRSHCDACGHPLNWVDLLPIFGYLIRGGRCHYCGQKIPINSFLTELLYGAMCGLLVYIFVTGFSVGVRWTAAAVTGIVMLLTGSYTLRKEKNTRRGGITS